MLFAVESANGSRRPDRFRAGHRAAWATGTWWSRLTISGSAGAADAGLDGFYDRRPGFAQ